MVSYYHFHKSEQYNHPATAQKMGQGLGAQYILTGSFIVMRDDFRIDARLVNVGNGEIDFSMLYFYTAYLALLGRHAFETKALLGGLSEVALGTPPNPPNPQKPPQTPPKKQKNAKSPKKKKTIR